MENNWTNRAWKTLNNMAAWEVRQFFLLENTVRTSWKLWMNDNTVAISDDISYVYFLQGEAEGVVIEMAHIDVRHPQQGRLKFLL